MVHDVTVDNMLKNFTADCCKTKNMSSGKQMDAILLDFSKAFDKVPH
jgi:hypothetical protein